MASDENELIDVSDDEDCFTFKPSPNQKITCWGSSNLSDLEILSPIHGPIKEVTSPVTEITNPVSELASTASDVLNMTITQDSSVQQSLETVVNTEAAVSESKAISKVEVKAELNISDGLLLTEGNEEAEPILVVDVNLKQDPEVDLNQKSVIFLEPESNLEQELNSALEPEPNVDMKQELNLTLEPEPSMGLLHMDIVDDNKYVKKKLVVDDLKVKKNEEIEGTAENVICDKEKKRKTSENPNKPKKKRKISSQTLDETLNTSAISKLGKGNKSIPINVEIPLQLGWQREVVHRATFSGNKRMADCYYKSPTGKKLRSMVEIQQYLNLTSDTSVTIEMFSYYKAKVTDHVNESERHAAKKVEKKGLEDPLLLETPKTKPKKVKPLEEVHPKAHSSEMPLKKHKTEKKKGKTKPSSTHCSNNANSISDLNPICNIFCEGYMGQLPDMNCVSCFCLFHPKCVGIFSSEEANDFICKNCLLKQSGANLKLKSTKSCTSNVSDHKSQKVQLKKHRRKSIESDSLRDSQIVSNVKQISCTQPSADSIKKHLKVYGRSVNSSPPKSKIHVPISNLSPSPHDPIISNPYPTQTQPFIPPICIMPISEKSHAVNAKPSLNHITVDPNISITPLEINVEEQNDYNYWTCTLPNEANALAHVFSYLHTKDLFNMKLVCSTWNAVAAKPFLWKHLYLQGLTVTNWNLLADFIEAKNVKMLNMRGMKMGKDIGEVWKQFNSILPRLTCIKELTLCKVPASIPYRLATKLENLTHFASEEIFDAKVDPNKGCKLYIGKFNKLKELRRLKLSGFKGLFIPKSIISEEFLNTDALQNLKHLSLTTFTGTKPSELESLTLLKELTVLELGNCADWTDEHYLRIGLLTKLKKLRLEYGGTKENPILCDVLIKLVELQTLELVLFPIPSNFIQVLSSLKHLQLLTVWPNDENGATNSYRLTTALKAMGRLKKFVWGLVASELVRDAANRKKMDDKVRCIPYFAEQNAGHGKVKCAEMKICANDLMEKLRMILPSTIIRVVIVSNSSYSSIRQASANK